MELSLKEGDFYAISIYNSEDRFIAVCQRRTLIVKCNDRRDFLHLVSYVVLGIFYRGLCDSPFFLLY